MIDYLGEILSEGLYSRTKLRTEKMGNYTFTDKRRYDGKTSRISVSVSYPNWQMLYNKRMEFKSKGWALLALDPRILWELNCWFLPKNAASKSLTKNIELSSWIKFNEMFEGPNRLSSIPENWTTDAQAEVMIKDEIPPKYIKNIIVETAYDKYLCEDKCKSKIEVIINKKLFGRR